MAQRPLSPQPLSAKTFAVFGEVIEASEAAQHFTINNGNTERYHDLARVDPGADGHVILSIFRGQPRQLPFTIEMMERHPKASQAFMPLTGRPYLVVVARAVLAADSIKTTDLNVFLAQGDQGVNYAPGVWHHPLLALHAVSDFLVIDRCGPGANCDETPLREHAVIII